LQPRLTTPTLFTPPPSPAALTYVPAAFELRCTITAITQQMQLSCRHLPIDSASVNLPAMLTSAPAASSTALHCCRNYSADATAFVITYPIDSAPANLPAALAWEAAFLELAKSELSQMAAAANLSLAFQAERWAWHLSWFGRP
jgi:hypothetical protein